MTRRYLPKYQDTNMHAWDDIASTIWHFGGNMQLAALDTDTYTKEASCIPSNLKIYEIILPNTIY